MSTLTVHALEPRVEKRIRSKAKREGQSLNRTIKKLLAESVGVSSSPQADHRDDFVEFLGEWNDQDAETFQNAVADFEKIDPSDWQS